MASEAKLVGALVAGPQILRYLRRQSEPAGVNRIARDLKLNPSTCFNLLRTLVHEQLAVMDPETKTYSLGLGLVELARGTLDQVSYVRFVRPSLERIAALREGRHHGFSAGLRGGARNDGAVRGRVFGPVDPGSADAPVARSA